MMTDDRVIRIFDTVLQVTGIDRATIESATRRRDVFFARMIVAHHLRGLGLTYSQIGEVLGGRSHATVMWQCDCYFRERTPVFRRNAERVREILPKKFKSMKQTGLYAGCSERFRAYHEARKNYEAVQAASAKLDEALAAMEDAPSFGTRIEAAIKRAIKQVEEDEEILHRQLRMAEVVYLGG